MHPEQSTSTRANASWLNRRDAEMHHALLLPGGPGLSENPRLGSLVRLSPPNLITTLSFNDPGFSSSANYDFSLSHLKLLLEEGNLKK